MAYQVCFCTIKMIIELQKYILNKKQHDNEMQDY